jgi:hypothetical protein
MTPTDKAKDLLNKYWIYLRANLMYDEEAKEDAKVCALIAVEETINTLNYDIRDLDVRGSVLLDLITYWREVKTEIEKL